ncbi:MAG: DUF1080 domain-containing protein [Gemmatimonadetes bacterium]|nr:DUF1080 domain-containing protein [Gemmatimonadota bacterium]
MPPFRCLGRALPGLLAAAVVLAVPAAAQQSVVGYDDTPLQPDGKWRVHDSRRPRPPVVAPGPAVFPAPPADAVVLLGPRSPAASWRMANDSAMSWNIADGVLSPGRGLIRSREEFGDVQLHVEFQTPLPARGEGQGRGNSGVFLACAFEIQVLDSHENQTYADGQAAAMYGQYPPLVNASRPPGEWQSYDIAFTAPRFEGERLVAPAVITVHHNGVLVHHARPFWGPTAHRRIDPYAPKHARGALCLQDHGNPVRFRNIWVRPLGALP